MEITELTHCAIICLWIYFTEKTSNFIKILNQSSSIFYLNILIKVITKHI